MDQSLLQRLEQGLDYTVLHNLIKEPREIKVSTAQHPIFPDDIIKYVDEHWDYEIKKRPQLRDGDVLGVDYPISNNDRITLPVYNTKFRYLLGTRFNQTPGFSVKLPGSGGITILKDEGIDYFLFGKRSPNLASVGGKIEVLPQGLLDKKDLDKDSPLDETILREAQEEIYKPAMLELDRDNVELTKMQLINSNYWNNIVLDYVLSLNDKNWLKKLIREDRKDYSILHAPNSKEHTEFYAVPRESLTNFIEQHLSAETEDERLGVSTRFRFRSYLSSMEE